MIVSGIYDDIGTRPKVVGSFDAVTRLNFLVGATFPFPNLGISSGLKFAIPISHVIPFTLFDKTQIIDLFV